MESGNSNWDTKVSRSGYECAHTADIAIFGFSKEGLKILLVNRDIEPFKNHWMLPGGMVQETQTLEESVAYVLDQLLGVKDVYAQQVATYSNVNRHPIKRVITTGFYALVKPEQLEFEAKGYFSEAKWVSFEEVETLGFDHFTILQDARNRLKNEVVYNRIGFELLPEKFTLKELQDLYEILLGEKLDRRNFRRKIMGMDMVLETNDKKEGVQGAPSLFTLNPLFK